MECKLCENDTLDYSLFLRAKTTVEVFPHYKEQNEYQGCVKPARCQVFECTNGHIIYEEFNDFGHSKTTYFKRKELSVRSIHDNEIAYIDGKSLLEYSVELIY